MKRVVTTIVKSCRMCPLFSIEGMEHMMYCNHPSWTHKGSYAGAIITQNNADSIPDKCPLRQGTLEKTSIITLGM